MDVAISQVLLANYKKKNASLIGHNDLQFIFGHLIELLVHWHFKRPVLFQNYHWAVLQQFSVTQLAVITERNQ